MMCLTRCSVEMIEQSKKDALLAEALADIGKIDELVRLLPNNLIKSTEALEDAGQKFRDSVDYYVSKRTSTTEKNVDAYLLELAEQLKVTNKKINTLLITTLINSVSLLIFTIYVFLPK